MRVLEWLVLKRLHICCMVFLGHFNIYTLRNTLNVAILKMKEEQVLPEYIWGIQSENVILTSFFPTYIVANVFGGTIAERFGSKLVFGLGGFLTAFVTLLLPSAARHNYVTLICVRAVQGIFQGLSVPASYTIYGRWFPKSERTILRTLSESGFDVGFLIGNTITGYLCESMAGWASVFYIFGGFSILWSVLWWIFVYETPSDHPKISAEERTFILSDQGEEFARKAVATPWRSILSSFVVWNLMISTVISKFFVPFIRQEYPSYLKYVFDYEIHQIAWMSMLPQALYLVVAILFSFLGNYVISHSAADRRTFIRKSFKVASAIPTGAAQLTLIYMGNNPVVVQWMMSVAYGLSGIDACGSASVPIDISPVFAGSIYGLLNALGNLTGIISPVVIGLITKGHEKSFDRWKVVFYVSFGTNVLSTLLFVMFVSADLQPWGLEGGRNGRRKRKLDQREPNPSTTDENVVS